MNTQQDNDQKDQNQNNDEGNVLDKGKSVTASKDTSDQKLVRPRFTFLSEDRNVLRFRLANTNVSLANAIRRTMLTHINSYALLPETCKFEINTGRLHNEILKHRLSCIPVHAHVKEFDELTHSVVHVDVENTTNSLMMVTTEHFRVRNEVTGEYWPENKVHELFPKCDLTQSYILFSRLRPKINDLIPGERLRFTCRFGIRRGLDSSCYSAVCTSTYMNTLDEPAAKEAWATMEASLTAEGRNKEEIAFQRRNFMLLDSQRYFVADSFDFMVESVGVHSNMAIFKTACQVLLGQFEALGSALESGRATILPSTTTTPHCFDFLVEDNDYTVGPVLEYFVYHKYFLSLKEVTYCGFKKFHPHNNDATLRMAIKEEEEETEGNEDDDDMNGVQTNGGQAEGDKQANGNQMGGDQVGGQAKDDEDNVENRITSDIKKEWKQLHGNQDNYRQRAHNILVDACRLSILYYKTLVDSFPSSTSSTSSTSA